MSAALECPRCHEINELSRVFCIKCGQRLFSSDAAVNRAMAQQAGKGRYLVRVGSQILFIALVVILGLGLWPEAITGQKGSLTDARQAYGKIKRLESTISAGLVAKEIFSEPEANGYLAALIEHNMKNAPPPRFRLGVREINLSFTPENITVLILAKWGPAILTYEMRGIPSVENGRFGMKLTGLRWGHLPIPDPINHWILGRLEGIFKALERERRILEGLERIELGPGRIRVTTREAI